jgi:hypothetical protein
LLSLVKFNCCCCVVQNQGSDIKTSEDEEHKDIKVDNDLSNEEKMSQDMEQDAPDLPQMEWPPQDFDPLEPVELPFGPRYLSKRVELAERVRNLCHMIKIR